MTPEVHAARIIPADAGSTPFTCEPVAVLRDHPRGCGEHDDHMHVVYADVGSSPRMRGALMSMIFFAVGAGIIPADAGSTWMDKDLCGGDGDHPRGCGEHFEMQSPLKKREGSSPRMRGAHSRPVDYADRSGIIPADAGSTAQPTMKMEATEDHPRGCGEHAFIDEVFAPHMGSSPRMRGALILTRLMSIRLGIIPADAGSTLKDHCNPNTMIDKISDFK